MNDFKDVALCQPVAVVKPLSDTDPLWSAAPNATSLVGHLFLVQCSSPVPCPESVHSASCHLINYCPPLIDFPRFYLLDSHNRTAARVLPVILLFTWIHYTVRARWWAIISLFHIMTLLCFSQHSLPDFTHNLIRLTIYLIQWVISFKSRHSSRDASNGGML